MRKIIGSLIILAFMLYFTVSLTMLDIPVAEVFDESLPISGERRFAKEERLVFDFISKHMVLDNGRILTNLNKEKGSTNTLSESVGLLMEYCVKSGKRSLFDKELRYLKSNMLTEDNLIMWREGEEDAKCNAAIDDLRIVRALMDAYDKWGSDEYLNLAGFIQSAIYDYQVTGRSLNEFYDWQAGKSKHTVPLCYLDVYTIDRISDFNKEWLHVEEKAITVISDGRINQSPFYYKYYNNDTGGYSFDEEYKSTGGVNLTYTLLTALHMAEVNEENSSLTQWLKEEIKNGRLYVWYNPITLKPVSKMESTAVYALAASYARKTGERELYSDLIEKMNGFMVKDLNSKYFGGFGDTKSSYFHSFDNLLALRAYSLEYE